MNLVHNIQPYLHKQYLHPVASLKLRSPSYYLPQSQNIHYIFPALFAQLLGFGVLFAFFFFYAHEVKA